MWFDFVDIRVLFNKTCVKNNNFRGHPISFCWFIFCLQAFSPIIIGAGLTFAVAGWKDKIISICPDAKHLPWIESHLEVYCSQNLMLILIHLLRIKVCLSRTIISGFYWTLKKFLSAFNANNANQNLQKKSMTIFLQWVVLYFCFYFQLFKMVFVYLPQFPMCSIICIIPTPSQRPRAPPREEKSSLYDRDLKKYSVIVTVGWNFI